MANNNFPPLEPDNSLPENLPEIPEQMAPLREAPVIEELTFEPLPSSALPPEPETEPISGAETVSGAEAVSEAVAPALPASLPVLQVQHSLKASVVLS